MLDDRPYMRRRPGEPGRTGFGFGFHAWPVTTTLIVVNVAVFALQLIGGLPSTRALGGFLSRYCALHPDLLAQGWIWQLLTFQFLHGGLMHLFLNCLGLYMFGYVVEQSLGRSTFLRLYLGSGTFGGLFQAVCSWIFPAHFGTGAVVGASAGVFGVIAAFSYMNRDTSITALLAFVLPISMRAKYLLAVLLVLAILGMLDRGSGVAHAAHLGGMLSALAYLHLQANGGLGYRLPRFRIARQPRAFVASRAAGARNWHQESPRQPDDLPPAEFISREVDPILEKISAHGIQSLTERERRILELARDKMTER